ncbi:MAG: hypothetical protein P0119_01225 [Nitrospira sp.]|nr:hypothetical protein [Nitrospira sp.]
MTAERKLIRMKLGLLELAKQQAIRQKGRHNARRSSENTLAVCAVRI